MKNDRGCGLSRLVWLKGWIALLALLAPTAQGQDLQELYFKASQLAQERKFGEALQVYDQAVDLLAEFAWEDYGPVFGGIYYDKGLCHLQLGQFAEAAVAFKASHEDFPPNAKVPYGSRQQASKVASPNMRWEIAVFQWGFAVQQLEDYDKALELYDKFLALEPDPAILRPIYSAFVLRKGKCLINTGKLDEGVAMLTDMFENPGKYGATGQALFQAMLDIALGWADAAKEQEDQRDRLAAEANAFFDKYSKLFAIPPYDKARLGFVDRLRLIGYRAQQAGLNLMAIRVFSMVPSTHAILDDLEARAAQSGGAARAAWDDVISQYRTKLESSDPPDVESLRLVAAAWEGLGNRHAGYVINRHLAERYPDSENAPQILHETVRFAFALGDANASQYFGEEFMQRFPQHELRDNVATFMLQSLFRNGKYEMCLELAGRIRNEFPEGDPKRELADFIYGATLYSMNRQEEAEPALELYVNSFPEGNNLESARFFLASNQMIQSKYAKAATLLDTFLVDYPSSTFRPQVLLDRATCYYISDDFVSALQRLDLIFQEHQDSSVVAQAYVLQGDVTRGMGALPEEGKEEKDYWVDARSSYLEGKSTAEQLEQADVRAEALFKHLDVSVDLENWEDAVDSYDAFLAAHKGNYWEPRVSVFAMPALGQVGRTEDGLSQLERMIFSLSEDDASLELLAQSIGSFQEAAVDFMGADKTLAKYDQMIGKGNETLQTQLLIHKVIVLQEKKKALGRGDEGARDAIQGEIDTVFRQLTNYDMNRLSDLALKAIGENLEPQNPFEAKAYFEELLSRENDLYKAPAEMALGRIEMREGDPNCVQRFLRIIDDYNDPKFQAEELIPEAYVNIGRFAVEQKDWETAEKYLAEYMRNKTYDRGRKERRAEAQFKLGLAYQNRDETDKAIVAYNNTFAAYAAYPQWSAQAVENGFKLAYERNYDSPEDQRAAQMKAYEYLRVVLYSWQKQPDNEYPALENLRLIRDRVEGELGLTQEQIREIEQRHALNVRP